MTDETIDQQAIVDFFNLKQKMIQEAQRNYVTFMESIQNFPVMKQHRDLAIQHFETAIIVLEKGMALVPFQRVEPPVAHVALEETAQCQSPEAA